ncbi:MAG: hypothetical protein IPK75_09020 [Acidobacteria bacterium]|nr:hypothetical protein [Acidobacteriota bacterium]
MPEWRDSDAPPDLSAVHSAPIRWVIEQALAEGNRLVSLAPWTKALVAHMHGALTPELKQRALESWRGLEWYEDAGSPHNQPDEGFTDNGFAVSFPRPWPASRP